MLHCGIGVASYGARDYSPLDFQQFNFFIQLYSCTKSDSDFVRLPLQTYLYSATAAAVIQSRLHEPCSLYYFASFYARQKVSRTFVPPSHQITALWHTYLSASNLLTLLLLSLQVNRLSTSKTLHIMYTPLNAKSDSIFRVSKRGAGRQVYHRWLLCRLNVTLKFITLSVNCCFRRETQVKGCHTPYRSAAGCSSPFLRPLSTNVDIPQRLWYYQTYSYLPIQTALPLPLGWYSFPIPQRAGGWTGLVPSRLHTQTVYLQRGHPSQY